MVDRTSNGGIKSVHRLDGIVNLLSREEPLTTREVADRLDIAKSTAHAYLSSMHTLEYVVSGPGGYSLSLKFLDYGMVERDRLPVVSEGEPTIEQLAADTSEAAYLVVEEHGLAIYVGSALGNRAVKTHARIGTRAPLHSLASGKAILAHLSESRVTEIIDRHGLPKRTENTIDSPEALREELEQVRERGYAVNEHEAVTGVRAVGAPILVDETVVGALSVAGPANRLTAERVEEQIVGETLAAANEVELKLSRTDLQ